jgi:antitoxin component YwqK of YwqJK toxin-antitoxin module
MKRSRRAQTNFTSIPNPATRLSPTFCDWRGLLVTKACLVLALIIGYTLPGAWSQEPPEKPSLGSKANPIRCGGVDGEQAYLSRLRDPEGKRVKSFRFGSAAEKSPFFGIMDIYGIETAEGQRGKIYLDMYHREYICTQPIPGLRILFEQDERYEYVKGKIHEVGNALPFSGEIESTDRDGNVTAKCKVDAGMIVGSQRYFYANGKPRIEYPFEKGVRHGVAIWYRENGIVWAELPFVEGRLEGVQTVFDEKGVVQTKVPYEDHQEHGTVEIYYENGRVRQSIEFNHGLRAGFEVQYDASGNETEKTLYVNGERQPR